MDRPDPTKCVSCGHKVDEHARGQGVCRHTDKRRKSWKNGRCPCKKVVTPSPHGTVERPTRRGRIPRLPLLSPYQPDEHRDDLTVGEAIIFMVGNGLASRSMACQRCGVFDSMATQWMGRGTREVARMEAAATDEPLEGEAPYVEFAYGMMEAVAARNMDGIEAMRGHHRKDWHAVVRTQQVLDRDSWDDAKQLEVSGPGGGPIRTAKVPSLDELEAAFIQLGAAHPGVIDVKEIAS